MKSSRSKLHIQRLWKNTKGSFTIEASLVFPIILFTTLLILFFCMYQYQNTMLKQAASKTSERASYSWDNSHKEPVTGAFAQEENDGLYWRLTQDDMLSKLFGWAGAASSAEVSIPGEMSGNITYNNQLMIRRIKTTLSRPVSFGALERELGHPLQAEVSAGAVVVEPVEFIRNVELLRYYGAKISGKYGGAFNLDQAGSILKMFGGQNP